MNHGGRRAKLLPMGPTNSSPYTLLMPMRRLSTPPLDSTILPSQEIGTPPLGSTILPSQEIGGLRIHLGISTKMMMMKLKLGSDFLKFPLGFLPFSRLRGFGWMLPAIGISMLLGTRTDTFFMALILPLAQSAASMTFDELWGASTGSMRPKTRYRKRGFRGAARTTSQKKYRREPNRKTTKSTEDYQSWVAAVNRGATEKRGGTKRAFGGWDDLDRS